MSLDKKRSILKALITSQFNYCPLVWMYHSRGLNKRINDLYERALNLKTLKLCLKMKSLFNNNISPDIMRDIFHFQDNKNYNLRRGTNLASRIIRISLVRKETKLKELKNTSSVQIIQGKSREWK